MFLQFGEAEVKAEALWYYRFQHPWDIALGLEGVEDLFSPCELAFDLAPGRTVSLIAGIEPFDSVRASLRLRSGRAGGDPRSARAPAPRRAANSGPGERSRRAHSGSRGGRVRCSRGGPFERTQGRPFDSAQHGAHAHRRRLSRDGRELRMALIALPGILLCTRRLAEAKDFLDGALSSLLAPGAEASATSRSGSSARRNFTSTTRATGISCATGCSPAASRSRGATIENSSETGYRLAADGLLVSSNPGRALTWMDATMDDWPVTPRAGKPVEVNALWHHALGLLARWAARRNEPQRAQQFTSLRELAGRSFRDRFWNAAEQCLFNVIDLPSGGADAAIRPNQIFAVSLRATCWSGGRRPACWRFSRSGCWRRRAADAVAGGQGVSAEVRRQRRSSAPPRGTRARSFPGCWARTWTPSFECTAARPAPAPAPRSASRRSSKSISARAASARSPSSSRAPRRTPRRAPSRTLPPSAKSSARTSRSAECGAGMKAANEN